MKRHGNLYPTFVQFDNLYLAFRKARKGAANKKDTLEFSFYLEDLLLELQEQLKNNHYHPKAYQYFKIYDPKERTISVACFEDRVVHHALINMLEPIFENCFIHHSYATRKNKGTHKAIHAAQRMLQGNQWFFKTDIDKYFESIQHDVLLALIRQKIKDQRLLVVIERIIKNAGHSNIGLPIGNLTSQFFANVYLNHFDHFVKHQLKAKNYVRYMDDFVLFSNNKEQLKTWKMSVESFLQDELSLRLKKKASFFNSKENGLTFLGRRIFPHIIRLAKPNLKRMSRRMKKKDEEFEHGILSEEKYIQSMNSYWAILEPFVALRMKMIKG